MTLASRTGLPDALRQLAEQYPRPIWESHRNFDALTRFWLDRHLGFRDMLQRISADAEAFLAGDLEAPVYGARSSRLIGRLLNDLHGHHQIEDQHYFPLLAALDPRMAAGIDLLERDHQDLDGHIHGLAEATNAMLHSLQSGTGSDRSGRNGTHRTAVAALRTRVHGFSGFIDRHLLDEEDIVVPAILHYAPGL